MVQAVRVVDRALADRVEHDLDLARVQALVHDRVVLRVPADSCPARVRLLRDVPLAVPRRVAAAISVTRKLRKAR